MSRSELLAGVPVADLLALTGLVPSKAAARRAIKEGGAYLGNARVDDELALAGPADLLHDRWLVLRRGRRHIAGIEVEAAERLVRHRRRAEPLRCNDSCGTPRRRRRDLTFSDQLHSVQHVNPAGSNGHRKVAGPSRARPPSRSAGRRTTKRVRTTGPAPGGAGSGFDRSHRTR